METKYCIHCGKELEPKRKTKKFCNSSCRAKYWIKSNEGADNKSVTNPPPLRGVKKEETKLIEEDYKSEKVKSVMTLKQGNLKEQKRKLELELKTIVQRINSIKYPGRSYNKAIGTMLGTGLAHKFKGNALKYFIGGTSGFLLGNELDIIAKKNNLHDRTVTLPKLIKDKEDLERKIRVIGQEYFEASGELFVLGLKKKNETSATKHESEAEKPQLQHSDKSLPPHENILSSLDLLKRNYDYFEFKKRWLELFGEPSLNFHCIIHGMPGEGKSTFALQFADYLARNFGRIIYVSAEEGFAKTLKDKLVNVNAISDDLYIADLRKYEDMKKEIKPNTFNFIFIDSLDTMGIGPDQLREFSEINAKVPLITISQSTKDGKIRGSNEIVHDADIVVKVENGIANTTKNRFLPKGKAFDVFKGFGKE